MAKYQTAGDDPYPARVNSITQLVSQVTPASSENACFHLGVGDVTRHVSNEWPGRS
jgi:hypothetical protein